MIKDIMKRQVFFIQLTFRMVFLFLFREIVLFTSSIVYVICTCRKTFKRSLKFFKIRVLKKFRNVHKKKPVSEFLSNKVEGIKACIFIKMEIPTLVFSCEYFQRKFLGTPFLQDIFTVHNTFTKFFVMIEFFGRIWVQN